MDTEELLGVATPSTDLLLDLSEAARRTIALTETIYQLEDALKDHKSQLHFLRSRVIPELLASSGVSEFKTCEGLEVSLKLLVNGSLPKDRQAKSAALNWLREHGGAHLIKNTLTMEFERGSDNLAGHMRAVADEIGIQHRDDETVHPQTLGAYARERINAGEDVDAETLGLFVGQIASVQRRFKP